VATKNSKTNSGILEIKRKQCFCEIKLKHEKYPQPLVVFEKKCGSPNQDMSKKER
jgi:hypothetical protein